MPGLNSSEQRISKIPQRLVIVHSCLGIVLGDCSKSIAKRAGNDFRAGAIVSFSITIVDDRLLASEIDYSCLGGLPPSLPFRSQETNIAACLREQRDL